jgi:hypothetical protein
MRIADGTRSLAMPKRKNARRTNRDPELLAIYDQNRREFTAADLQKYTVIEEGVPFEDVIADCKKILKAAKRKRP